MNLLTCYTSPIMWLFIFLTTCSLAPTNVSAGDFGHHSEVHSPFTRTVVHYKAPSVTLVDQRNQKVQFDTALADTNPALVEFFFTTCTTFCDVRSVRLAAVQHELAEANIPISFFSISVNPEFDRPERLQAYATRVKPFPTHWWLLTGTISDIEQVETSFNARNPSADKMLHQPLTFIRGRPGQEWIRLEGMMSSHELVEQIKIAVASTSTSP